MKEQEKEELSQLVAEISRKIAAELNEFFVRGNTCAQIGTAGANLNEAIKAYDKALEIDPSFFEAWNNKGVVYRWIGEYGEALNCFKQALKIVPNWDVALINKGNVLNKIGRYKEAIETFDEVIGENRENWRAFYGRAEALFHLREEKADENYKIAYYLKARELIAQKKYKFALNSINLALKIDPENRQFLKLKIEILKKLGRKKQAKAIIDSIERPF